MGNPNPTAAGEAARSRAPAASASGTEVRDSAAFRGPSGAPEGLFLYPIARSSTDTTQGNVQGKGKGKAISFDFDSDFGM